MSSLLKHIVETVELLLNTATDAEQVVDRVEEMMALSDCDQSRPQKCMKKPLVCSDQVYTISRFTSRR